MTIKTQIVAAIKQYDTIVIHRHQRPDPDAIGSQMGLAAIIRASFPDKKVYCVGKQYPGFDWMGKADVINDDVYKDALVIVTDTANQPRVDDQRYTNGKMLIKIDHHPNDDAFGDLIWVEDEASSCSELIYDLFDASDDLKIDGEAGRLLYAGIVGDTGRFKYPSTTSHTFWVASKLADLDFSISDVNQIEDAIDLPQARLAAYVYQNLTITDNGAAYLVITNQILSDLGMLDESTASIVPLPGRIKGVKNWAIFVQQKDGSFRIRLRSKGPVINELAKDFGGGGHPLASGAFAQDEATVQKAIAALDRVAKNYKGAIV